MTDAFTGQPIRLTLSLALILNTLRADAHTQHYVYVKLFSPIETNF